MPALHWTGAIMRFGNKAGYNQLMAQDAIREARKPIQGKAGLILLCLIALGLGFALGLAI
jgi:hypothetical protein